MSTQSVLLRTLATCVIIPAQILPAQTASPWRYWKNVDGLKESHVFGLTAGPAGSIIVKYGTSPYLSVLDGYRISDISSPELYGRVLTAPGDPSALLENDLWSFDAKGIVTHGAAGWKTFPDDDISTFAQSSKMLQIPPFMYSIFRAPDHNYLMDVVPAGNGTGLVMLPDRLVEWNRTTGTKRVIRKAADTSLSRFNEIRSARDGGFWIAGATGLARLKKDHEVFTWNEYRAPAQMTDLLSPIEGKDGEVLLSVRRPDGKRALVRFSGTAWTEIFVGTTEALQGWRDSGGEIWVQNDAEVLRLKEGRQARAERIDAITGLVAAVVSQSDGGFWLGTTEGVVRYSPPLWRTPEDAVWAYSSVNAITADNQGRIWFLSGQYLVVNDHEKWRRYPLPSGESEPLTKNRILVLTNGELALRADPLAELIIFNPRTGTFRKIRNPEGKAIGDIAKRIGGSIWVQVFEKDGVHWRLEIFDGKRWLNEDRLPMIDRPNLQVILEANNRDIWLGFGASSSSESLGRIRDEHFQTFGSTQGFHDTGVFSAVETSAGRVVFGGTASLTEYDGASFRRLKDVDLAESVRVTHDGLIWVASGSGIHRYHPGQWVTNTMEDGLPADAVHDICIDSQGRIWAGTSRGISLFHPGADPDPPVTTLVDNQNLRKTPPGGDVRLTFSGVDKWKFTSPDRLTFSWRMDGTRWSDFEPARVASFNALHAGEHRFEVRAMDRNGNVDPSVAQYEFSVLLPWYLQKYFLILAGFAVFVISALLRVAWQHHRKVKFQSRHDSLTGLANRAVFEANCQEAIADARAAKTRLALILLDLDHFKRINDTMGHLTGDRFLQEVSARLKKAIRKRDTLARVGGDEFAILMPEIAGREEAESMAIALLDQLRRPYCIDSFELTSSASIGVSLFPDHGEDAATLQRLSDMAMYQCKAQNKDEFAVFDPNVNTLNFASAQMAGIIREALENGYFQVHYQPVRVADGELFAFEALIRMEHPRYGQVPPKDFIAIAEDTGLIVRVGEWVLREACRQMAHWRAQGLRHLRVSVNVSAVQLVKPNFIETVRSALSDTALDPRALSLEITESAMMRNFAESRSQIEQLRSLGVSIAIDDFGTGYSSLSSLHLLPVDYIKIDRSFIQRLGEGEEGLAIVQPIIQMVHRFGFEVVAEGVELPEQLASLKSIGCDLLQGFLLGRPLSAANTQNLLGLPNDASLLAMATHLTASPLASETTTTNKSISWNFVS
ncbi:MAG TPA: EAL domain-containing protein [Bryobacteraceae bacterium]|nr:EAL domain-containing protein [Bryobacteraceae bacterium]